MTPNSFAFVALLLLWPVVALWLYSAQPIGRATIWTILGAYLLLPVGTAIQLEGVPSLDKVSIPNLLALIGCVMVAKRLPRVWHRFGTVEILILMLIVGAFLTSLLNTQRIASGDRVLPGLTYYDGVSAAVSQAIFIIPFILARQFLRSADDTAEILRILVMAGLAYSLLLLFEVRMSPQLHKWVYGYNPHSFAQHVRDGGYRPMAFLGHGLIAAYFAMIVLVASAALWRAKAKVIQIPPAFTTVYFGTVLVFCKSLASVLYGAMLAPLVRLASPRLQLRVAVVLAVLGLTYPMLRTMDLVPTAAMVNLANSVSADRARSLKFRFDNEEILLEHAWESIWFGWGRWGRNRIHGEKGKELTTTDGRWIITLGTYGLFGFIAEFGLLALSVFRAASALKLVESERDKIYLAALALIVAISIIDLLPNGFLSPLTWLLAGGLLGRAEALRYAHRSMITRRQLTTLRPSLDRQREIAP